MPEPGEQVWEAILAHVRRNDPARCRQWFEQVEVLELNGGVLRLRAPQPYHLAYLQRECRTLFTDAAQAVTGRLITVQFHNGETSIEPIGPGHQSISLRGQAEPSNGSTGSPSAPDIRIIRGHRPSDIGAMVINPDYNFETFIVGPNNRLAHAAARAVVQHPGEAYNPYFIHGGVGLGKTHLLQAICQTMLRADSPPLIYYVSCEEFTSQFMDAVQAGQMAQFRHRFRDIDMLVVDDIHFLSGHDRTQEEFFHTFNSLYQLRKQIVLSSDAAPQEIPKLEERLLSRFKSGLVAPIERPDYETRLQILRMKASLRGLEMPDDVFCYIAHRIESNIRELEGALTQLQGQSMVSNMPIDLELARRALGDEAATLSPSASIQDIIHTVNAVWGVKTSDILSKKRHKSIAEPRQVAMYLARLHTSHSLQEIGGLIGGRDHTTVLHAVNKIRARRTTEPALNRRIEQIEHDLQLP